MKSFLVVLGSSCAAIAALGASSAVSAQPTWASTQSSQHASTEPSTEPSGVGPPAPERSLNLRLKLDFITHYSARGVRVAEERELFHEFDLPRAHFGAGLDYELGSCGTFHGTVLMEGVRSAGNGALVGIDGNSLMLRFREAYAGYSHSFARLQVRMGLVPTATISRLQRLTGLRTLGRLALEHEGFASPSDLGASVQATFEGLHLEVGAGIYNGEGYRNRELNRGKSAEASLTFRPLGFVSHELDRLAILASFNAGSVGTGSTRADRVVFGVFFDDAPPASTATTTEGETSPFSLKIGAMATYAWGVEDRTEQRALLFEGFARLEVDGVIAALRGSHVVRDTRASDNAYTELTAAVGYAPTPGVETYLAVTRGVPGDAVETSGEDVWSGRVIARLNLEGSTTVIGAP